MEIARRAIRGVVIIGVNNYLMWVINIVSSIVLARLLEPEHFGVVALATFFVAMIARVRELGLDQALIHRKENIEVVASVHLFLQVGFAITIVLLGTLVAIPVGWKYGQQTALVTVALSFFSAISSITSTYNYLLDRELKFKIVGSIALVTTILASLCQIGLALAGWGLWSLVLGWMPSATFSAVAAWYFSPIKLSIRFDRDIARWLFRYGPWWHWLLASTAALLVLQFDNFLVGTIVGATALGLYTRAYGWATLPTTRITHILSKVAFPTYGKLQSDRQQLSQAYTWVLSMIARLTFPLSIALVLVAREGTVLLIGEKWLPMVPVFQLLLGYMLLRPLMDDSEALLTAVGAPRVINNAHLVQAAFILSIEPILVYLYGGEGAAICAGVAMLLGVVIVYRRLVRFVDIPYREIFFVPIIGSIVGTLLVVCLENLMPSDVLLVQLASKLFVFGIVYVAFLAALEGKTLLMRGQRALALLKG